jgi:3-oxoacyl-[acyl-carrier-protein] synthase II
MTRGVVVTGVGCLGAFGTGLPALAEALAAGRPCASPIDRSGGMHRKNGATLVAACAGLDLTPWLSPQAARRMSDLSQFAVAAARMARADAGLAEVAGERTAVAIATALGPGGFTEQLARQILEKGGRAASPFLFTDCVANAAAGQIAIDAGARGPNVTICQREAGPVLALAQGAAEIASGRADVCLAGAADEMKPLVHALLDRFRTLSRPDGAGECPRPFDRRRNGALGGEGATVFVLEAEDVARARGARMLARVGPSARAFDPTASRAGFGRGGEALAATLRERLGPALAAVDVVVSGASGSRAGDALEAALLRALPTAAARVLAPKAVHGEFGGGTLAAALLALRSVRFAMPAACDQPDPTLDIRLASGEIRGRAVLVTACAAGGVAAATILLPP